MSYDSQSDLSRNPEFRERVRMCVAEQAGIFVNDERPEYRQLALQAISALDATTDEFVPFVSVRPGMTESSADGDILSAVQYLWPTIGARYVLPTLPAPVP